MKQKNKHRHVVLCICLWVLAILFLIPVYYLVVSTFKSAEEVATNPFSLPSSFDLSHYVTAWEKMNYPRAFMNTLIITVGTVVISQFIAALAAYSITRYKSKFNKWAYMLVLAGMMIPGQVSLVSLYTLVQGLHLNDSIWGMIVINCGGNTILPLFLYRSFISTSIPVSIEEAAEIDGCGMFRKFIHIVLPLLKPVSATVSIIVALGVWNDYMNPMLFLQSRENATLILEVQRNVGQFSIDWISMFPMLLLDVAPLAIFYLFMQKRIISGVVSGAVKG